MFRAQVLTRQHWLNLADRYYGLRISLATVTDYR